MTRTDFIKDLEKRLKYLPKEDRDDAIAYYNEYLDDCDFANDEDVAEKIGTPKDIAREIIENCTAKAVDKQRESGSVKGTGKIVWLVILAVASIPVSLPIAIALTVIVLVLMVVIFAVLFALFMAAIGIILGGIACIGACFVVPEFTRILVLIGCGTFLMGFGLLLMLGIIFLFKQIIKLFGKIFTRKKEKNYE